MVSATTFSLVGVINKFITVLLNICMWDKHSSSSGLVAVCICLLAGSFYQQSPKRSEFPEHKADVKNAEPEVVNEESDPLLNEK